MTYPEKVNESNFKMLQQLIVNGADVHPGARRITSDDGFPRSVCLFVCLSPSQNIPPPFQTKME